jgi:hypothetical protein
MTDVTTPERDMEKEISVWLGVLDELLWCMPLDIRLAVLARATADQEDLVASSGIRMYSATDIMNDENFTKNYWEKKEAKSLLIQVLVRNIVNNASPERAAEVLFHEHRNGTGSGWLPDYLDGLPGIKVNRKQCAAIADGKRKHD